VDKKVRSEKTDQILKGANPADIPFYQPTQLSLWSISKLRKIGLTVSEPLLTRADEVIE
jgi:ABC-type uncharacterized transport system substrate-binding protein